MISLHPYLKDILYQMIDNAYHLVTSFQLYVLHILRSRKMLKIYFSNLHLNDLNCLMKKIYESQLY